MIEESYVSRDTARMLKEAGFDEVCRSAYYATGNSAVMYERNSMLSPGYVSRPTQALAARWLREVHHYAICVWFSKDDEKWFYAHGDMDNMVFDTDYNISEFIFDSYEEAMEAGLQKAIKLIKK